MTDPQVTPADSPASPASNAPVIEDDGAYSEFLLHSRTEIRYLLRSIQQRGERFTAYFNQGKDFLLTTILDVDDEGFVLDRSPSPETNAKACATARMVFVGSHDRVKIQFSTGGASRTTFEGDEALRCDLPDTLLRLQRREFYRLPTPLANPLRCNIPLPPDAQGASHNLPAQVLDISGGGVAILAAKHLTDFPVETVFRGCRLELPNVGTLDVDIELRSIFEVTLRNGMTVKRAGCRFVNLPGSALSMIQRYVLAEERERKARESGMR